MFKNSSKKKWIISVIVILIPLNIVAFYLINQTRGIAEALEHIDNQKVAESLHQKGLIYNFFAAIVITIDLAFILIVLYLLFKLFIKSLKNSNQE